MLGMRRILSRKTTVTAVRSFSETAVDNLVVRIGITGGPCGGKTTSLARIQEVLPARGFDVIVVPE